MQLNICSILKVSKTQNGLKSHTETESGRNFYIQLIFNIFYSSKNHLKSPMRVIVHSFNYLFRKVHLSHLVGRSRRKPTSKVDSNLVVSAWSPDLYLFSFDFLENQ